MTLERSTLFQIIHRGWRPVQQWGFAIVAVAYAARTLFELSFKVETFAALAAAGGIGFLGRGAEKTAIAFAERKKIIPDGTPADPVYVEEE